MSTSPSPGPPKRWSMVLSTMSSTLSEAMMRKGDTPKDTTCPTDRQEKCRHPRGTGIFFRERASSTNRQEANWESTVAQAAPATSMWNTKMNRGSRAMFSPAPSITVAIPSPENPWQMRKLFIPVDRRANTVPAV